MQMLPVRSTHDVVDVGPGHSVLKSKRLRARSVSIAANNAGGLRLGQLGVSVPRSRRRPSVRAALAGHVGGILGVRSDLEVRDSYARRIVACVHQDRVGERSMTESPCNAMSPSKARFSNAYYPIGGVLFRLPGSTPFQAFPHTMHSLEEALSESRHQTTRKYQMIVPHAVDATPDITRPQEVTA